MRDFRKSQYFPHYNLVNGFDLQGAGSLRFTVKTRAFLRFSGNYASIAPLWRSSLKQFLLTFVQIKEASVRGLVGQI